MPEPPEEMGITYVDRVEAEAREGLARAVSDHTKEKFTADGLNPIANTSPIPEMQAHTSSETISTGVTEPKKKKTFWEKIGDYVRGRRGKSRDIPNAEPEGPLETIINRETVKTGEEVSLKE